MNVIEKLRYLNSADGPNIPMRTLAAYCGITATQICWYINGKTTPKQETMEQMEKGIRELCREIQQEVGS